jgi:hypothetical protein
MEHSNILILNEKHIGGKDAEIEHSPISFAKAAAGTSRILTRANNEKERVL